MNALKFWRSYDKEGHAFYSARIKGLGQQIAIACESTTTFVLELDGAQIGVHHRLADAKHAADLVASRLLAEHHDAMIAAGVEPPELF